MENRMKLARLLSLLVVALVVVPFAHADGGQVSMAFTGVNGANNGVYYVSPYYGVMSNGTTSQNVVLFCDDINNEVYIGETWQANVTNLGTAINSTNGFANTRYGGVSNSPVLTSAAVSDSPTIAYEAAAWLTTQFTSSNKSDYVNLQYAIWDIMTGVTPTSGSAVAWWYDQALSDYSTINPYDFEIVTNLGPLSLTGQVQEFIVQTPEPGTLALLLCGLLALAALTISRARLGA
jgi:hypothetical protein